MDKGSNHVGLIVGIGPAAAYHYYTGLLAAAHAAETRIDLTMAHADASTAIANLANNNIAAQVEIYVRLTERLAAAGCSHIVVTSIGGHFCIEAFEAVTPLPVINLLSEVEKAAIAKGVKRLGILGTATAMQTGFYGALSKTDVVAPPEPDFAAVHTAYVTMASSGQVTPEQQHVFRSAAERQLAEQEVEAVMLGGTDLCLAFDPKTDDLPLFDCAQIHIDAIFRVATEEHSGP